MATLARQEGRETCAYARMQMYMYARMPVSKYREDKPEYMPLSFYDTFK
jgi:hypothetical protein